MKTPPVHLLYFPVHSGLLDSFLTEGGDVKIRANIHCSHPYVGMSMEKRVSEQSLE